ncbi:MAG: type II secretion system protein [Patescibacteria group bacterium]
MSNRGFTQSLENDIVLTKVRRAKPMSFFSAGFTLIEVMVVIAIIGILSVIVIVNMNNARLRAVDARIKMEINSIRRAAAIYYGGAGNESYGNNANSCNANSSMFKEDGVIANLIDSVEDIDGVSVTCRSNGSNFAVSADLVSVVGDFDDNWCIDSSGAARITDDPPAPNVPFCP